MLTIKIIIIIPIILTLILTLIIIILIITLLWIYTDKKNDLKNGLFCGYDDSFYGKPSSNLYSYYGVHFCTVNYLYITLKYFTVI